jgi:hypothetical protein
MLVRRRRAIKAVWADFTFTRQDNLAVVPRCNDQASEMPCSTDSALSAVTVSIKLSAKEAEYAQQDVHPESAGIQLFYRLDRGGVGGCERFAARRHSVERQLAEGSLIEVPGDTRRRPSTYSIRAIASSTSAYASLSIGWSRHTALLWKARTQIRSATDSRRDVESAAPLATTEDSPRPARYIH